MADQKISNPGRRQFFTRMLQDVASVVHELHKFEEELREGNVTPLVSQAEYQTAQTEIDALEAEVQQLRSALDQEQADREHEQRLLLSQIVRKSSYVNQTSELLRGSLVKEDQAEASRWEALQERLLLLATGAGTVILADLRGAWIQDELYPQIKELPKLLRDRWEELLEKRSVAQAATLDEPSPIIREPQVIIVHNPDFPEMITIPAGYFWMGSDPVVDPSASVWEQPQHQVYLSEYAISKHPITNAQYLHFVHETAYQPPRHWDNGNVPTGKKHHPAVCISWDDVNAYCGWLSRKEGRNYGLPTEAQWEKAARGTDGRIYPWGNQSPNSELCNFDKNVGSATPVGSYPQGTSPYDCLDMAGNVWEWTADWFDENYYKITPDRDPIGPQSGDRRVLRGGSWGSLPDFMRAAIRFGFDPDVRFNSVGFRLRLFSSPDSLL